jgi:threonine synthase
VTLICTACRRQEAADSKDWRCSCGGAWQLRAAADIAPKRDPAGSGLWRWHISLPEIPKAARISLGEGETPLVAATLDGEDLLFKCDYCNPTGSWKDRGWAVAISHLKAVGVDHVYEDSSGNAGASIAAYGARAGMQVSVFVPDDSPGAKRLQIAAYGAQVVPVAGGRDAVAAACLAASTDGFYAGHAWNPWFLWGPRTLAWELLADLDGNLPDAVAVPVGQGGLLLGLAAGFAALHAAGQISTVPRLVAAQAAACAPVVIGWDAGEAQLPPVQVSPTLADAIRTPHPVRYAEILAALRATRGTAIAVSEEEISSAHRQLAHAGMLVEPTSAVAAAAALRYRRSHDGRGAQVAAVLTGSGLKTLTAA